MFMAIMNNLLYYYHHPCLLSAILLLYDLGVMFSLCSAVCGQFTFLLLGLEGEPIIASAHVSAQEHRLTEIHSCMHTGAWCSMIILPSCWRTFLEG